MTLLLMVFVAAIAIPQQAVDLDRSNSLDLLCGKLVRSEPRPIKGKFYRETMQQTSLSNVELRLYTRRDDSFCCQNLSPVAKVMSGDGGQFEFKNMSAGAYWLAALFDGRVYKMLIRYQLNKTPTDRCADLLYEITDSGSFELGRIITASH
jgi:hypothetical protein